jgi:hypothetical protein
MATYLAHPSKPGEKLPFFVELIPHLRPNDGGPAAAIRIAMQRWRFPTKPHIVADSGFGSFPLLKEIARWGGVATLSIPSNECQKLDSFLTFNLPVGKWRACVDNSGIIFSAQVKTVETASQGQAIGKKFIVSNAFQVTPTTFGAISILGNSNGNNVSGVQLTCNHRNHARICQRNSD